MGKFRLENLKLATYQIATFGDNDEGKMYYDGNKLVVSGTGVNVKFLPAGNVVLDGVSFPTGSGIYDQVLTLSGTYDAQWGDFT